MTRTTPGCLKLAFEEWEDNQQGERPSPAIHREWINFVLKQTLGLPDEVLAEGQDIPQTLRATIAEHGETLRPDIVVRNPEGVPNAGKARLLVQIYPPTQDLEKPLHGRHWKASPATRMMELLHATDTRLGLVTNGERLDARRCPEGGDDRVRHVGCDLLGRGAAHPAGVPQPAGRPPVLLVADDETLEAMLKDSAIEPAGSHRPAGVSGPRGRRGDHPLARPDRSGREAANCWRASPRPTCTKPP